MNWAWLGQTRAGVAVTLTATALLTLVLIPFESDLGLLNEGLLFLLMTLGLATLLGVRAGLLAAVLSNLALNFFFVPPLHQFIVHGPENILGLIVFLIVSIVAGSLVSSARASADRAQRRQEENEALLRLTRGLIGQTEPQSTLESLCREVVETFAARGAAVLTPVDGGWSVLASAGDDSAGRLPDTEQRAAADRVMASDSIEGLGYSGIGVVRQPRIVQSRSGYKHQRAASVTFIPLRIGERPLGVLRFDGPIANTSLSVEPDRLLAVFAREAALAMQRVELAQAASHAEAWRQADGMKSALMASISHDLKTPLAAIKTSVSGLLDSSVNWSEDDKAGFLETIESQTDRLDRVISDILALNRIQSGALATDIQPSYVLDLLEEAREAIAPENARAIEVNADESLRVRVDRGLLRQALVNLIENANRYAGPGSTIRMEAVSRAGQVDIVVADNGPGIAAADLPYVFDNFYRGESGRRYAGGSGLGLAIVKAFVELSGGQVRVESSPAGTRFILTLPTAAGALAPQAVAP